MTRCAALLPLCAAALLASGCEEEALSPPTVRYGQDMCHECGMILSEERFAGAIVVREGRETKELLYDDIGEMLADDAPAQAEQAWFVRAYDEDRWLPARGASYVHSPTTMTPMATGLVAFAEASAAGAFAEKQGGRTLTFDEARAEAQAGALGVDLDRIGAAPAGGAGR